jgi:hypothetical protein
MEDYSKVAADEEKLSRPLWRKLGERSVRLVCFGVKRAAPTPKIKEKENSLEFLEKLLEKGAAHARFELE